ncbi:type II secretion system F family protein [Cytobacillus spongiae]|uniref:type II secretion system F family protein n=1 Tax=Cytobacillus spongiae TaxID=2901381 RepID=UPI001F307BE8|nr:type II secretion system F family protein [Cytobacillus spongiae]UII56304.1 type II secretion system F family protein [Cytobacillus spongiae]
MTPFLVSTLAAFMLILSVYFFLDYRMEKREWRKNVHQFYQDGKKRKSVMVLIGDRFDRTEMAIPIYEKLRAANIPFTPSEYIGAQVVVYMGIIMLFQRLFNMKLLASLLFAVVTIEIGKFILFIVRKNYMKQKIVEQLPEICRTLANATRSGMTLTQGLNLVAQEVSEPAKGEFQRLAQEIALGMDFSSALKSLEKRINSREFQLFVATLLIQKKAGGNLYAVLDEMNQTLEERKILIQEVKTMTAEQRYVSYIVPVIPIFLVAMMNNVIDGFMDSLTSGVGLILGAIFVGGTILTFILVRKVTNIRV